MIQTKWSYATCLMIFLCVISIGCGKKNPPVPQKKDQVFGMQNVFVYINSEGTLAVEGEITGALVNVQSITFEVEPLNEACPTCPFIPIERFSKRPNVISLNSGEFSFTVMPAKRAKAYRWRIIGHNIISGLPAVHSPVFTIRESNDDIPVQSID